MGFWFRWIPAVSMKAMSQINGQSVVMPEYLTRKEVAVQYPISYNTLAYLVSRGEGPRYMLIGKNSVYMRADVEAYFASQFVDLKPRVKRRGGSSKKSTFS